MIYSSWSSIVSKTRVPVGKSRRKSSL